MILFQICKATLQLSLSDNEYCNTNSESDEEGEEEEEKKVIKPRIKICRKRRKKKKIIKKRAQLFQDRSDGETAYKETTITQTSLSVFDLIATEKIPCQISTQKLKIPQPRAFAEKKIEITKQLAEVQTRLYALKNKLWFGAGQGDSPLSWGGSQVFFPANKSGSPQKTIKKVRKKSGKRSEKDNKKEVKLNAEKMEKSGLKLQNGIKRQQTISWIASGAKSNLRKSKSLPDTTAMALSNKVADICLKDDQPPKAEKPKKKKKGKFSKKAKAVSNAKVFVTPHRD